MHPLVTFGLGAAAGVGLSFALVSARSAPVAECPPLSIVASVREAAAPAAPAARAESAPAVRVAMAPALPPLPPPAPADASAEVLREENETLRAQIGELRAKVQNEQVARVMAEGKQVVPPESLPARFNEAELRRAIEDAIRQSGLKGQITSVDCTEYPCIVFGDGFAVSEEHDKLMAALQGYKDDGANGFGWNRKGPDGKDVDHFGLALFPSEDKNGDRGQTLRKRLQYRIAQMREAE